MYVNFSIAKIQMSFGITAHIYEHPLRLILNILVANKEKASMRYGFFHYICTANAYNRIGIKIISI